MKSTALDVLTKGVVAVACNDAGAANIIINWLRVMPQIKVRAHLGGPAIDLWHRAFPETVNYGLKDALQGSHMLLSGTGWASSLEYDARNMASEAGVFSVAVIDHWVNYEERFIRNERAIHPDEIWVVDEYGYDLALSTFPSLKVRLLPNYYLIEQVKLIKAFESTLFPHPGYTNILYALEPIRSSWGSGQVVPGEFQALDYFIYNLEKIIKGKINIKLRPHPSGKDGKYDDWVSRQGTSVTFEISKNSSLHKDIAWSDIVVGCQTYVLILGLNVGKRTISSLPPHAPESLLPYREIEELRRL